MPDSGTMPASDSQEPADLLLQLALPRSQKVVLVIDLVESLRLMSADEVGTVARWHGFVQQAQVGSYLEPSARSSNLIKFGINMAAS